MSYILDALRKADAQRARDPARGIHALPLQMSSTGESKFRVNRVMLWGAMAVGLAALAAVAWQLVAPSPQVIAVAPVAIPVAAPVAAPAPAPAAAPTPAQQTVVSPAASVSPPAPAPLPVPQLPLGLNRRGPIVEVPKAAPSAANATAPAASTERAPNPIRLPPEGQGGLPKLTITGGVYSENPAQRMLIVNGQVFSEGAEPVPGVLLEQIRPSSAVLKFGGIRYTVAY